MEQMTKDGLMEQDTVARMSVEELEAALAERRSEADPVVIDVGEDGAATISDSKVLAKPDGPPPWAHRTIEFYGDTIEVRKPTAQGLAGFSMAAGKYIPQELQNSMVSLFLKQHMSGESLEHVLFRLMDPDDEDYAPATIGELMRAIALLE